MIEQGDALPDVTLMRATGEGPQPTTTHEVFGRGRSVLFAVPGAYTPTCSARHLPGYVEKAEAFKEKGVDRIACTAVNDAFVLQAWGEGSDASGIEMLADGNGDLARALGLTMDGSAYGMGERSQRYAMVIEDGKVTHLFVEEPGAFEVSSAEHVLSKL